MGLDFFKPGFQEEYVQLEVCKYTSAWECKGVGSGEIKDDQDWSPCSLPLPYIQLATF